MDDVNAIYEALGVETPAEPDPTPEDPAPADPPEDAAPTEPPEETTPPEPEESDESEAPTEPTAEPPVQDNAANAAARRRAEREIEIARVREEERARQQTRTDEIIAAAFGDKLNPFTGKPIRTERDYQEYRRYYGERGAAAETQTPTNETLPEGVSEEAISALIAKNPIVQKAHRVVETVEAERAAQQRRAIEELIARDIERIAEFDKTVVDAETLFATKNGAAIRARVESGRNTLYDAWRLENFDAIVDAKAAAATRAAQTREASKEHLQTTKTRNAPSLAPVPSDQRAMFEAMGFTSEEEQTKAYNKWLKSTSG